MKWLTMFGRFWYDFIVGDSVALAIGGLAVLAVGALLVQSGARGLAELLLPLIVAATLAASLRSSRK